MEVISSSDVNCENKTSTNTTAHKDSCVNVLQPVDCKHIDSVNKSFPNNNIQLNPVTEESEPEERCTSKLQTRSNDEFILEVNTIITKDVRDASEVLVEPIKKVSDVDETIQDIYRRRLNTKIENFGNKHDTSESKTAAQNGEDTRDTFISHTSESFTGDDDIIMIDDDDELPCSQMFDIKEETLLEENSEAPMEYGVDLEEVELSEEDSDAEEWFQKLSQSVESDFVSEIDNDNENNEQLEEERYPIFHLDNTHPSTSHTKILRGLESTSKTFDDDDITNNESEKWDTNYKVDGSSGDFEHSISSDLSEKGLIQSDSGREQDELGEIMCKKDPVCIKRKLEDLSGGVENQTVKKLMKEKNDLEYISSTELSEPLLRKLPSGAKRKLPDSSDEEDLEDNLNVDHLLKESMEEVNINKLSKVGSIKATFSSKTKIEESDEEKMKASKESMIEIASYQNAPNINICGKVVNDFKAMNNVNSTRNKIKYTKKKNKNVILCNKLNHTKNKSSGINILVTNSDMDARLENDIGKNKYTKQSKENNKISEDKSMRIETFKRQKKIESRNSSVESNKSSSSSVSTKSFEVVDIFKNDENNLAKELEVMKQSNTDHSCMKSSKNQSVKRLKRESELNKTLLSESDSNNSSDIDILKKNKPRRKTLQSINETVEVEDKCETSSDSSSTISWRTTLETIFNVVVKKCEDTNILKIPSEKPSTSKQIEDVTKFCNSEVETKFDGDHNKSGELFIGDIELQIKPNTISKSQHFKVNSKSKDISSIVKKSNDEVFAKTSKTNTIYNDSKVNNGKEGKIIQEKIIKPKLSFDDEKLDAVNKKILASQKKKTVPIIDAKSLKVRRKQADCIESDIGGNKEDQTSQLSSEKWLSKGQAEKKVSKPLLSKADMKAIRRAKLKDISKSKKDTDLNTSEDKPKIISTAKNTTKITNKSRNEIFLDTLVSTDKETTLVEKNNKEVRKEKGNLSSFKIPRRASKAEELTEISLENTNATTTKNLDMTLKPVKHTTMDEVILKSSSAMKPNSNDCMSLVDQIIANQISDTIKITPITRVSHVPPKIVGGVDYEEPFVIKIIPDTGKENQPSERFLQIKPIIKLVSQESPRGKSDKKKVKFHRPGDTTTNVLYVTIRDYIAEGTALKPVTRNVKKDTPPPKKKDDFTHIPFTSYFQETIHQICKWNPMWLEEKKMCKGEPKVFSGQIYHLKEEFDNYNDYRRGMFPLILYELWQAVAKQYDLVYNKYNKPKKLFNIEIRHVTLTPVINQCIPLQKENEERVLQRLECQVLFEQENQGIWPRPGDLLVIEIHLVHPENPKTTAKCRTLGYILTTYTRAISTHRGVSPKLKLLSPNASQVMDFTVYIRDKLYVREKPAAIDISQETKMVVLKNIKSELREFEALDRLPSFPLASIICQPKANTAQVPSLDVFKAAYPPVTHLNASQKTAAVTIAKACANESNVIHLVHGPPGCGKSEVIIGIIMQMWFAWHRKEFHGCPKILLCAPSNAAIDDIFIKLMSLRQSLEKMPKFNMVRIGRTDMTHKNVSSMTLDFLVEKELKKDRDLKEDEHQRVIELGTLEAKRNQLSYQLDNLGKKKNDVKYVENVQKKLAETIERMKELDSGKPKRALGGRELREKKQEIEFMLLENANIIATTLSSCYNTQMERAHLHRKLQFTCCIVDEATQCTEPETLIPLMLGVKSFVLVGDPQQLPATVLSPTAKTHGLNRSLFARQQDWWLKQQVRDHRISSLYKTRCYFLDTQYRMHPAIAKWPSEYFYQWALHSHSSLETRSVNCPLLPYIVLSHDWEQSHQEECNLDEVKLVIHLIRSIVKTGHCEGMTFGVITPYNRQKEHIRNKIDPIELPNVEVGTVDSYQGRERDIVLFSCVRTEGVGFMSGTERLNVALTRAKHSLLIIGNFKSLQGDPAWKSLLNNAKSRGILKPVVRHNQDMIPDIFKTSFISGAK